MSQSQDGCVGVLGTHGRWQEAGHRKGLFQEAKTTIGKFVTSGCEEVVSPGPRSESAPLSKTTPGRFAFLK